MPRAGVPRRLARRPPFHDALLQPLVALDLESFGEHVLERTAKQVLAFQGQCRPLDQQLDTVGDP